VSIVLKVELNGSLIATASCGEVDVLTTIINLVGNLGPKARLEGGDGTTDALVTVRGHKGDEERCWVDLHPIRVGDILALSLERTISFNEPSAVSVVESRPTSGLSLGYARQSTYALAVSINDSKEIRAGREDLTVLGVLLDGMALRTETPIFELTVGGTAVAESMRSFPVWIEGRTLEVGDTVTVEFLDTEIVDPPR
jgi:hypothetical protein